MMMTIKMTFFLSLFSLSFSHSPFYTLFIFSLSSFIYYIYIYIHYTQIDSLFFSVSSTSVIIDKKYFSLFSSFEFVKLDNETFFKSNRYRCCTKKKKANEWNSWISRARDLRFLLVQLFRSVQEKKVSLLRALRW